MKCHCCSIRFTLTALVALAIATPLAAGEQVPFRGRLEGIVATVTPLTPPFVAVTLEGEGHATQLGHFDVSSSIVANEADGTAVGTYEFTAANGDTLSADFTGQSMPTATLGVISITETATIKGGTGRFDGATGSFTSERTYDTFLGTTTGSFKGTLSSPGTGSP